MVFFHSRALYFFKKFDTKGGIFALHQALYRKWRPSTFDEVCGQEHITSVLKYEAMTGTFSHAYLFCGSRGTGKTTCAKILSRAVNCLSPRDGNPCGECAACRAIESGSATDVLEMDAASNNGVEDIRDIRDEVIYAPSDLKYRVYIIDEVHMLSTSAFNALLKTLEEPPAHVVFILATTELHKLPATIISRCQRFDFRRISTDVLASRLMYIAKQEDILLDSDAARLIARQAQGGMRDAISLLELCAGSREPINSELVDNTIGSMGRESMIRVAGAIADRDFDVLFDTIDKTVRSSKDISVFWQELISLYRDMLVVRTTKNAAAYLDLTDSEKEMLEALASRFNKATLLHHCRLLDDAYLSIQKANTVKRIVAEMTLVRMCDPVLDTSNEAILSRIARLEESIVSGAGSMGQIIQPAPTAEPSVIAHYEKQDSEIKQSHTETAKIAIDHENVKTQSERVEKATPPLDITPKEAPLPKSAAKKATIATSADSSAKTRTLRPIRAWNEAVERVRGSNPMSASFFKQARAYLTDDDKIVIKFPGEFQRDMAYRDNSSELVRAALSFCLQKPISSSDISSEIEAVSKTDKTSEWIDKIIEAAEE